MKPIVLSSEQGELLSLHEGNTMLLKAVGADTDGRFALCTYRARAGWTGPEPHIHQDFEEAFFVLSGSFEFLVGDQAIEARPGTFLLVPRGVEHSFSNPGDSPAELIGIFSPSGAEEAFRRRADHT